MRCVLRLLYKDAVTIELKKCRFFAEKVDHFGHPIRAGRFVLTEDTTDAVAKLEHPTTQMELG